MKNNIVLYITYLFDLDCTMFGYEGMRKVINRYKVLQILELISLFFYLLIIITFSRAAPKVSNAFWKWHKQF